MGPHYARPARWQVGVQVRHMSGMGAELGWGGREVPPSSPVGERSKMDGALILSRDETGPWIVLSPSHKAQSRKQWGSCACSPGAPRWLWGVEPGACEGPSR